MRKQHDWFPIGTWHQFYFEGGGPTADGESFILGERKDEWFIIRACYSHCRKVWWEKYDPVKALEEDGT